MNPTLIAIIIILYFGMLVVIARITSRHADNASFFLGNRKSPWYIVAYGMIGASLSGITFISVPGWVGSSHFSYFQMVLGYLPGYLFIYVVLLPIYYKLNVTSIYTYLEKRFGFWSYQAGVLFFLFSRTFGAAARLFIVAGVLQYVLLDQWHVPFVATIAITIGLIWVYTQKGGIKTIIWTDTLQTTFMLIAIVVVIVLVTKAMNLNLAGALALVRESDYSQIFDFNNFNSKSFFWKQFFGGAFIAIAMTGLDQDMMQKNLSCHHLKGAQQNMFWFSLSLVPVNLLFLSLGALLYIYAATNGIQLPADADMVFPEIATGGHIPIIAGVFFILGIIAAAYSSADSALTALTTSFSVDILGVDKMEDQEKAKRTRQRVHVGFSILLLLIILTFRAINNTSVIDTLFVVASYTYGPLLGLFILGIFTKVRLRNSWWVMASAVLAPIISWLISKHSQEWFNGYQFGYELLLLNAFVMILLLLVLPKGSNDGITPPKSTV